MWHDMGWGGMWFGWIFWLLFLGVIIWAVIRFTNSGQTRNQTGTNHDSPMDILKKRYARGEINKEQFEEMKKDLQ